jgi:putative MATE family efflux protein
MTDIDKTDPDREADKPRGRGSKSASIDRDWTKGSIVGNLWSLSWPISISSSIRMMGPTIDMIWVGALGTAALAGVGVSGIAVQMITSARMGLNTGTRAILARAIGAGDKEAGNHVAQQAIVISIAFSLFTATIGVFLAEPILTLLGLAADVVKEGTDYMRIMFVGSVAMSFGMLAQGVMQASGDSITPMKIDIGIRIFHVILCPFLVFGWGIFPALGVSGAALTNVISQGIGGAIMLWILFTGRTRLHLTLRNFSLDGTMIWRIVKIGLPASITSMERSFANFFLMLFIVPFGTAAVAAHALAQRIDVFVHMPAQGLGQGAGVLAGQNMGAGQPERAERTGWIAAALFTAVMAVASVGIWFWAEPLVRVFNSDPELVEIAATFLRIDIISYLVFGLVVVLMNCLNGVGDTIIPMLTTLVTMWMIQLPLAWILPIVTDLGVYGIRWGIVTAIVMRAVIYAVYFRHGRWKRKIV